MKTIVFLFTIIISLSCVNSEKPSKLQTITKQLDRVAKKHNCILTYEATLSEENETPLSLTIHNPVEYTATIGAIIEDCHIELSKKNIHFSRYVLKTKEGILVMSVAASDLEQILKCKPIALKVTEAIANKNLKSVEHYLDTAYFKQADIELIQQYSEKKLNKNYKHIGFELMIQGGSYYCMYEAVFDKKIVAVTTDLMKRDCKIFGMAL